MAGNTEKRLITARGYVQKLFFSNPGYRYSVTQIRNQVLSTDGQLIDRKTIKNAIREMMEIKIPIESEINRVGIRCIPVKFYYLKK